MSKTLSIDPPKKEIPYPDSDGPGGFYMEEKASMRLYNHQRNLPEGWWDTYKYRVEVLGGFASDAGRYPVCVTDDLEVAGKAWEAWNVVCPTMVAVIDRDTRDQVKPYFYG